jgi:DNA-binding XRE family transcriptional regulator
MWYPEFFQKHPKDSRVKLAKRVGITRWSLSRYERRERIPRLPIAVKIAKETHGLITPDEHYNVSATTGGAVQPADFYTDLSSNVGVSGEAAE